MNHSMIVQLGGAGLLNHYASLADVLRAFYPDYPWQPERFRRVQGKTPLGFWKDKSNLIKALDTAEEKIGIKKVPTPPPPHNTLSDVVCVVVA